MENNPWGAPMMAGEKTEPGIPGAEYTAPPEGAPNAEGAPEANYMYTSHAGHNGAAPGEGY